MICDDSAVIRGAIGRILAADPQIRVVANAGNGQAAIDALKLHDIDVVVLDIEMPVMDGLTALPLLLKAQPGLQIIMASTLTARGADVSMRALRLGAADYMPKPSATQVAGDTQFGPELIAKIHGLTRFRRRVAGLTHIPPAASFGHHTSTSPISLRPAARQSPLLLAIGSSTGGPNALFKLVQSLSPRIPVPIIITQHMPAAFTPLLAEHINKLGVLPCHEALDGQKLVPGEIALAPGDLHLLVKRATSAHDSSRRDMSGRDKGGRDNGGRDNGGRDTGGGALTVSLSQGAPENFCRPAVDPMLRTASAATDGRVLAIILTGMGSDGMEGVRGLVNQGGAAIAQDEATSVVWGMPGAVARAGLAHAVLPLDQIGPRILSILGVKP